MLVRITRDDAIALMQHFAKNARPSGTQTAHHEGYDDLMSYKVRSSNNALPTVMDWAVPGLFVAYEDISTALRPWVTVFYRMGCGTVLYLVVPKWIVGKRIKIPNNLTVLQQNCQHNGENGCKIALEHWRELGNMNDLVRKEGAQKRRHYARRASSGRPE